MASTGMPADHPAAPAEIAIDAPTVWPLSELLTANSSIYLEQQDRARSAAAGIAAHLVEPVDLDQLRMVIESLAQPLTRDQ